MTFRFSVRTLIFVNLVLVMGSAVIGQERPTLHDLRTRWTKNPRIKPARFHTVFMCTSSFGASAIKATKGVRPVNCIFKVA
jgi:hypothetical protein